MSEPKTRAESIEEIAPGLWRWFVADERIDGFESDAYALRTLEGTVLIDPLPLAEAGWEELEEGIVAICLTAAAHQRSAWRLRARFDVPVHAPEGSREMDEEPDERYGPGDALPGGLIAVHTPGPEEPHYSLFREDAPSILFTADLIMRMPSGELVFVPPEHHEDPAETRASAERLLALDFEILCLAHGEPITDAPHEALRALLDRTPAAE